jgi:hypothetical protein
MEENGLQENGFDRGIDAALEICHRSEGLEEAVNKLQRIRELRLKEPQVRYTEG